MQAFLRDVAALKAGNGGSEAEELREALSARFVMPEEFWSEWIEDEERRSIGSGTSRVIELHRRALLHCRSVPLWAKLAQLVEDELPIPAVSPADCAPVRAVFDQGLLEVGSHWRRGKQLWSALFRFELKVYQELAELKADEDEDDDDEDEDEDDDNDDDDDDDVDGVKSVSVGCLKAAAAGGGGGGVSSLSQEDEDGRSLKQKLKRQALRIRNVYHRCLTVPLDGLEDVLGMYIQIMEALEPHLGSAASSGSERGFQPPQAVKSAYVSAVACNKKRRPLEDALLALSADATRPVPCVKLDMEARLKEVKEAAEGKKEGGAEDDDDDGMDVNDDGDGDGGKIRAASLLWLAWQDNLAYETKLNRIQSPVSVMSMYGRAAMDMSAFPAFWTAYAAFAYQYCGGGYCGSKGSSSPWLAPLSVYRQAVRTPGPPSSCPSLWRAHLLSCEENDLEWEEILAVAAAAESHCTGSLAPPTPQNGKPEPAVDMVSGDGDQDDPDRLTEDRLTDLALWGDEVEACLSLHRCLCGIARRRMATTAGGEKANDDLAAGRVRQAFRAASDYAWSSVSAFSTSASPHSSSPQAPFLTSVIQLEAFRAQTEAADLGRPDLGRAVFEDILNGKAISGSSDKGGAISVVPCIWQAYGEYCRGYCTQTEARDVFTRAVAAMKPTPPQLTAAAAASVKSLILCCVSFESSCGTVGQLAACHAETAPFSLAVRTAEATHTLEAMLKQEDADAAAAAAAALLPAQSRTGVMASGVRMQFTKTLPAAVTAVHECTVFVSNLHYSVTEQVLSDHFAATAAAAGGAGGAGGGGGGGGCGVRPKEVRLVTDKKTGKPKGYGYVEFMDKGTVAAALRLHGSSLAGRTMVVRTSDPPDKKKGAAVAAAAVDGGAGAATTSGASATNVSSAAKGDLPASAAPGAVDPLFIQGEALSRAVKVYGLAFTVTNKGLETAFEKCGPIERATVSADAAGLSRGNAVVLFKEEKGARNAMFCMGGQEVEGRKVSVKRLRGTHSDTASGAADAAGSANGGGGGAQPSFKATAAAAMRQGSRGAKLGVEVKRLNSGSASESTAPAEAAEPKSNADFRKLFL